MQRQAVHAEGDGPDNFISRKARDIRPFLVMDVLERAQAIERETGADVIHLEVGEPDFPTPPFGTPGIASAFMGPPCRGRMNPSPHHKTEKLEEYRETLIS